jgi:hypothetical protein
MIMAKSKIVKANEKITETVVGGYKKIESTVVGAYTKIEDRFVDQYLTHDNETVAEAKARLKQEQAERETAGAVKMEEQKAAHSDVAESSLKKAQEAGAAARKKAGLR